MTLRAVGGSFRGMFCWGTFLWSIVAGGLKVCGVKSGGNGLAHLISVTYKQLLELKQKEIRLLYSLK